MTDSEMLELAAKAIGLRVGREPNGLERGRYDLYWSLVHRELVWHDKTAGSEYPEPVFWNPLTDDGDAFRLAVKLSLPVHSGQVYSGVEGFPPEKNNGDSFAATRRAIVCAAATIGEKMR